MIFMTMKRLNMEGPGWLFLYYYFPVLFFFWGGGGGSNDIHDGVSVAKSARRIAKKDVMCRNG